MCKCFPWIMHTARQTTLLCRLKVFCFFRCQNIVEWYWTKSTSAKYYHESLHSMCHNYSNEQGLLHLDAVQQLGSHLLGYYCCQCRNSSGQLRHWPGYLCVPFCLSHMQICSSWIASSFIMFITLPPTELLKTELSVTFGTGIDSLFSPYMVW